LSKGLYHQIVQPYGVYRAGGPRTALPPKECERTDCYFHQHYGPMCKATIVVIDGFKCLTYRQFIGEVQDYA